jgi:hypothetical protein
MKLFPQTQHHLMVGTKRQAAAGSHGSQSSTGVPFVDSAGSAACAWLQDDWASIKRLEMRPSKPALALSAREQLD